MTMTTKTKYTYKVVLVGGPKTGKTSFVTQHRDKKFASTYVATFGVEVHPVQVGDTSFQLWDCAGQEKFKGLGDGYYIQAKAALVFFDIRTLNVSDLTKWFVEIQRVCEYIPIIVVGTHSDLVSEAQRNKVMSHMSDLLLTYCEVSSKDGSDMMTPFDRLDEALRP